MFPIVTAAVYLLIFPLLFYYGVGLSLFVFGFLACVLLLIISPVITICVPIYSVRILVAISKGLR